jgi:hypothetical protein
MNTVKRRILLQTTLLLLLSVCVAQAASTLTVIGRHPFYKPPLQSVADLQDMMQSEQEDIMIGLEKAGYPELYEPLMEQFPQAEIKNVEYEPGQFFDWMLFKPNGVGETRVAQDITWGGDAPLSGYEFSIDVGEKRYTFAVPLFCGNIALKEAARIVVVEVPGPEVVKEVQVPGPERIVEVPGPERIVVEKVEVPVNVPGPVRTVVEKVEVPVNVPGPVRTVVEKVEVPVNVPGPERTVIKEVEVPKIVEKTVVERVEVPVTKVVEKPVIQKVEVPVIQEVEVPKCCPPCKYPIRFVADLGYWRQSDPADYGFGRLGVEYALHQRLSFLVMAGGASKVDGDDGYNAFIMDFLTQYNLFFLRVGEDWRPVFLGFGVGTWMTDGQVGVDTEDSDVDIIAQIGTQLSGSQDGFNTSLFLEARSAIDETDALSEYGRFGIGLRFRF